MARVIVSGAYADLRSADIRFLQAAAEFGDLHILLWTDETCWEHTRRVPRFPWEERRYVLQALRGVAAVHPATAGEPARLPATADFAADLWVVTDPDDSPAKRAACARRGIAYRVLRAPDVAEFPAPPPRFAAPGGPKVVVTGCYDMFHSGHVRFFEEAAGLGELHVVVGNDANVRQLKGPGHPLIPEAERRFVVGAVRHVAQALISSGAGWMDAAPEIDRIKPDIYAVNEDGDRADKREFCARHGLRYVVLKRLPKAGLVRRSSTELRGY